MAATFLLTLIDSAAGLLLVAAVVPLGPFAAALAGLGQFRLGEAMLLAFFAAWLMHSPEASNGPRLPRYATIFGWLFSVLVVSLTAGVFSQLARYPDILRTTVLALIESYFSHTDPTGFTAAAGLLEGLAVATAAIELFRQRPVLARSLPVALTAPAVIAALLSVLLWFGIGPARVLARQGLIGSVRVSAHLADMNAAGTHFAVILCLTLGMSVREQGRRRAPWLAAGAACAMGLWMSRSRSAEAALSLVIPAAALWAATISWPRSRRVRLIGGAIATVVVIGAIAVWRVEQNPAYSELGMRGQFVMSSFRIIGTHPYFGLGAGQYYHQAPLFLTPQLAWTYGSENAHNNYLQLTVETGIIGFFLFATWFAGGLQLAISALLRTPRDWRLLGATAGVVTFLVNSLVSHPLVVQEAALVVFLLFALMASLGASSSLTHAVKHQGASSARLKTPPAFWPTVAVVGTVVFGVWPALTVTKPQAPVHLEEVDGFYYAQETDEGGVPFRWTREYASVFVPAWARRVELTMRAPAGTPPGEPMRVEITAAGVVLTPAMVGDAWKTVVVELHPSEPPLTFNRINFKSDPVTTHDGRPVGVRVGEIRIARFAYEVRPDFTGSRQP